MTADGREAAKGVPERLFKDVTYYIVGNIGEEIQKLLNQGGAKRDTYLSEMVSHVIADSIDNDEYCEACELFELPVVMSSWVTLSIMVGKQLPKEKFALEGLTFSGVVACPSQLNMVDVKALWSLVVFNGGVFHSKLTNSTTHLITASTSGAKYETAMKYPEKVKVVTPDWVIHSFDKHLKQDEVIYHPRLIVYPKPEPLPLLPPSPEKMETSPPFPVSELTAAAPTALTFPSLAPQVVHSPLVSDTRLATAQRIESPKPVASRQTIAQILSHAQPPPPPPSEMGLGKEMLARMMGTNITGPSNEAAAMLKGSRSRPGTPSAKLALARMVNNRLQAGAAYRSPVPVGRGSGVTPLQVPESFPEVFSTSSSPITCSPQPQPQPLSQGNQQRTTLRNITNSVVEPPKQPQWQSSNNKIGQMLGHVSMPTSVSPSSSRMPIYGVPPVAMPSHPVMPQYWGHDPADKIPPDMCLIGCVFFITNYQDLLGYEPVAVWKKVIEQHGGQVDNSYSNGITHVLCASQQSNVCRLALRDQKRVVSAYWLNDCLVEKRMFPPCQVMHLPILYGHQKPCTNQIISVTNFSGDERLRVKQMINAIGAKYTGYMTHSNSVLVCKRPDGLKYDKAKEWRIPVINVHWLTELVLGNVDALRLPVPNKYLILGQGEDFKLDLNKVTHLMVGWCSPLKITRDSWKRFIPCNKNLPPVDSSVHLSNPSLKKSRDTTEPPVKRQRLHGDDSSSSPMPRVLLTGFGVSAVRRLRAIAEQLGGSVVENPRLCTHLVAQSLSRTMKFFVAINVCKYIVVKEWLEDSLHHEKFLDEDNYSLKDTAAEKELQCKLVYSLQRARARPLFKGFIFYITPSVLPPPKDLQTIIESAGGSVIKRRLSAKQIASLRDDKGNPTFIVITCPNDIHLSRDLLARRLAIFNAEFVLTGVLRQEVDFELFRLQVI